MIRGYLIIYKGAPSAKTKRPLGDLAAVTEHLNGAFPGLQWKSATETVRPDKDFTLQLGVLKGFVQSASMGVGTMPLKPLTEICKKEGWRLEDPDVETAEDGDLDDPEGWRPTFIVRFCVSAAL